MQYVEDRLVAAPWSTALSIVTLFLSACAAVLWLGLVRDLVALRHTPETAPAQAGGVHVVLAGQHLALPAGLVRFPSSALIAAAAPQPVATPRLELRLVWRAETGPATGLASPMAGSIDIVLAAARDPLDAAAQFERLYRPRLEGEPIAGPGGLIGRALEGAGGEIVYYLPGQPGRPFYLRCARNAGDLAPATCYRRIDLAGGIRLEYRFGTALLAHWRAIEAEVTRLVAGSRRP